MHLNVTKKVVPENLIACEDAKIWINVTTTGEPSKVAQPLCLMLILDRSSSMVSATPTTLSYMKDAAKTFVANMNLTRDSIGIVTYGTRGTAHLPLGTYTQAQLNTSINSITNPGLEYTNMDEGIRIAQNQLNSSCPSGKLPVMILFTDGVPTAYGSGTLCSATCPTSDNTCTLRARSAANVSKSLGTTIFSVGYLGGLCGTGGGQCSNTGTPPTICDRVKTLSRDILSKSATNPEYFFEAPTASQLAGIYSTISSMLSNIEASDLTIMDDLALNIFNLNGTGDLVQFTLPIIHLNESWNTSINITSSVAGIGIPTNDPDSYIRYKLPNGTVVNKTLPVPTVNVQMPLILNKSAPSDVIIGENFNFTIELNHIGTLDIKNLTINDTLCNNVTYVSHSCSYTGAGSSNPLNVNYNPANRTFVAKATGPLKGGDRIICNITVYVNDDCAEDGIVNEARAYYDRYPCIISQTETDTTDLKIKRPNFTIIKTAESNPYPAIPGTKINFTIWINNTGNVNLTKNSVEDRLEGAVYSLPNPSGDDSGPGFLNISEKWKYEFNIIATENIGDICDGWINNSIKGNFSYRSKLKEIVIVKSDWANVSINPIFCISGIKTDSCNGQPLSGWKIEVFNKTTGNKMGENTTNATGYWRVCGLVPGSYWANETLKEGWQNANPNQSVVLGCANATDVNFRNTPLFCINGHKYNSYTDEPLAGWKMEVFNKTTGTKIGENTTNATGYWQVCNLVPGSYWVNETLKAGWKNANPNQSVVLGCQNLTEVNFRNTPLSSNVSIIKTATIDTVEPGDNVTYIINVTNTGDVQLSTVRVVDILPPGLVYVSDNSTPPGVVSGNLITWSNVGPLAVGASKFIELIAKVVL